MKTTLNFVFFFASIFLTLNANAQGDYVITAKGDTIRCKISAPFMGGGVERYKVDGMRQGKIIYPHEIEEYYVAKRNELKRSVHIDSGWNEVFLDVVENGKISLYQQVITTMNANGFSNSNTDWYVGKNSNFVTHFKSSSSFGLLFKSKKRLKSVLGDMLKDNADIYEKYMAEDQTSLTEIKNMIHLYNTGIPLADK